MTAQTTTRSAATGVRIAPLLVVIIAILAFGAGLAVAQVAAPVAPTAVSQERVSVPAPDVTRGTVPMTSQEDTTFSGWTDAATDDDGLARHAGRHR